MSCDGNVFLKLCVSVMSLMNASALQMLCCEDVIGPLPVISVWVEDGLSNVLIRLLQQCPAVHIFILTQIHKHPRRAQYFKVFPYHWDLDVIWYLYLLKNIFLYNKQLWFYHSRFYLLLCYLNYFTVQLLIWNAAEQKYAIILFLTGELEASSIYKPNQSVCILA